MLPSRLKQALFHKNHLDFVCLVSDFSILICSDSQHRSVFSKKRRTFSAHNRGLLKRPHDEKGWDKFKRISQVFSTSVWDWCTTEGFEIRNLQVEEEGGEVQVFLLVMFFFKG